MGNRSASVGRFENWAARRWVRALAFAGLLVMTLAFVHNGPLLLNGGHYPDWLERFLHFGVDTAGTWPPVSHLIAAWSRNVLLAYLSLGLLGLARGCTAHGAGKRLLYCCAAIAALVVNSAGDDLFGQMSIAVVAGVAGILMGSRLPSRGPAVYWGTAVVAALLLWAALMASQAATPLPHEILAGLVQAWAMMVLIVSVRDSAYRLPAADAMILVVPLIAQLAVVAYPAMGVVFGYSAYLCVIAFGILAIFRFTASGRQEAEGLAAS